MRQPLVTWMIPALGCAFLLAVPGCELPPNIPQPKQAAAEPEPDPAAEPTEAQDPAVAAVQRQAELLAAAQRNPIPADAAIGRPIANEVMWIVPGGADDPQAVEPEPDVAVTNVSLTDDSFVSAANTMTVVDAASEPASPTADRPDIEPSIYDQIAKVATTDFDRALRSVGASLAEPDKELDKRFFSNLNPEQMHAACLYYDIMQTTRQQLLDGDGRFDRDAFAARLDELLGQQPISISDLRLCKRVNGFGVFEPFETSTFLSGREQRMIVYVELDDFAALDRGDGHYIVDLEQEITLYSADGLAVWRNEPVQITDVSANRRRDFFVVQLVKLPDRLGVGKYRMKVRVTDRNGGSIDEQGIDLDFVADRAMVERPTKDTTPLR